jgi:hypothetical protein
LAPKKTCMPISWVAVPLHPDPAAEMMSLPPLLL